MADGSYYEGEFADGEINGNGFRHFASNGSHYSGEFVMGEMHGQGVLTRCDGSTYKGEWYRNKRQGKQLHLPASPPPRFSIIFSIIIFNSGRNMSSMVICLFGISLELYLLALTACVSNACSYAILGFGIEIGEQGNVIYEGCYYNHKRHGEGRQCYW